MEIFSDLYENLNEHPEWVPDEVELEEGTIGAGLRWRWQSDSEPDGPAPRVRESDQHVVARFVELHGLPEADRAKEVCRFARRFGVLELCRHNVIRTDPYRLGRGHSVRCEASGIEPIDEWVAWSQKAAALLRLLMEHKAGDVGAPEDWQVFSSGMGNDVREGRFEAPGVRGYVLSVILSKWCRMTDVRLQPHVEPKTGNIQARLGGVGVLGAVTRQLVYFASSTALLAPCHGCGTFFQPPRKPRMRNGVRERSWCEDCKDRRIHRRQHQREHRARNAPTSR